jgi:chromosome segregation ATPase
LDTTIIAAIVVGVVLLWGGVLAMLKMVDLFENKHIIGLGAYTTLVASLVMGLVLVTIDERQKDHRRQMQEQMTGVTDNLDKLSAKLINQLSEKADLTASEFTIRAKLQNERITHDSTRTDLAQQMQLYSQVKGQLADAHQTNRNYQETQDRKLNERFQMEEKRYQDMKDFLQAQQRSLQTMQKQLASVQLETGKIKGQTAELQKKQNTLLGKVTGAKEAQDLNTQRLAALARSQAALHDDLNKTMAEVDSLYTWKKK